MLRLSDDDIDESLRVLTAGCMFYYLGCRNTVAYSITSKPYSTMCNIYSTPTAAPSSWILCRMVTQSTELFPVRRITGGRGWFSEGIHLN
jgi:hypothetical protein